MLFRVKISYRYYECNSSPDGHLVCDKDGVPSCAPNFFGPACSTHCLVPSGLQHMHCDTNGTIVCNDNYFGENCTVYCKPPLHGMCDRNGSVICDDHYYGAKCDTLCFTPENGTGYCDSNGTLICNLGKHVLVQPGKIYLIYRMVQCNMSVSINEIRE